MIVLINLVSKLGNTVQKLKDYFGNNLSDTITQAAFFIIMKNYREMDQSLVGDGLIMLAVLPLLIKNPDPVLIKKIIQSVATPLCTKTSKILVTGFVLVSCSCLAVDAKATLDFLSQANMITAFVNNWLDDSAIEPSLFFRQVSILALIELIKEPILWTLNQKFTWKTLSENLHKRLDLLKENNPMTNLTILEQSEPIYFSMDDPVQTSHQEEIEEEIPQENFCIKTKRLTNELRTLLSLVESEQVEYPLMNINFASHLRNSLQGNENIDLELKSKLQDNFIKVEIDGLIEYIGRLER